MVVLVASKGGDPAADPSRRNIGLIGLVAASLLLCSAQSFELAPRLFRVRCDIRSCLLFRRVEQNILSIVQSGL